MSSFTESTVTKKRPAQRPLLSRNIINNGNFCYVTAGKIYFRRQVFWTVSFTEMRDPVYYGRIQYVTDRQIQTVWRLYSMFYIVIVLVGESGIFNFVSLTVSLNLVGNVTV